MKKLTKIQISLCLALALFVFVSHSYFVRTDAAVHGGDQVSIRALAREVFTERSFRPPLISFYFDWRDINTPDDNYPPIPILVTGVIYKLFSGNENAALYFNALAWGLSVFIWVLLSLRTCGSAWPGMLLFLGLSFPFGILGSTASGLKEHFFGIFLMFFLFAIANRPSPRSFFLSGISIGAAYLCRYNALILLQLSPLLVFLRIEEFSFRSLMKNWSWFMLGVALIATPWWVRNYIDFGNPIKYLVTTYPFSWVPGLMNDFYSETPPTPKNLAAQMGWMSLLSIVLKYQVRNIFVYFQSYAPLFGLWFGIIAFSIKLPKADRSLVWVYALVTVAMVPGALYMPVDRYWFCSMLPMAWCCVVGAYRLRARGFAQAWIFGALFALAIPPVVGFLNSFDVDWVPTVQMPIPARVLQISAVLLLALFPPTWMSSKIKESIAKVHSFAGIARFGDLNQKPLIISVTLFLLFFECWRGTWIASWQDAGKFKAAPIFAMHRNLGLRLKAIARPTDVICSHYPAMVYYYTGIPTVSTFYYPLGALGDSAPAVPREELRARLRRVQKEYGITLITDLLDPNLSELGEDLLELIEEVPAVDPTLAPVKIFRIKSAKS
jgi:hypothetical protein